MNKILNNLCENLQDNVIARVDANLEPLEFSGEPLSNQDINKLKTDLCAIIYDEISKAKSFKKSPKMDLSNYNK